MTWKPPEYLQIPADRLGEGGPVKVRSVSSQQAVAEAMAEAMLQAIRNAQQAGRAATLIVPVGPVDQFPILAKLINQERVDCRDVALINMDEYLDDDDAMKGGHGTWLPMDHPLSFRGFMERKFYALVDPALAPRPENRVFPDPQQPQKIQRLIDERGGVDVCFGGIGINGHIAFNEPPEPAETATVEAFAGLPTRVVDLARETRTINSVTVGGDISVIPRRAVTIGMKEILASRRLGFYCNRPWQRAVVRRALHGPITPDCPASLLRLHGNAEIIVADYVAQLPEIELR